LEDHEDVYDREIAPRMTEIIAICKRYNIPILASFEYADGELCTTCILPENCSGVLVDAAHVIYHKWVAVSPLQQFTAFVERTYPQ